MRSSGEGADAVGGSGAIAMGPKLNRSGGATTRSEHPADPAARPAAEKSAQNPNAAPPATNDSSQAVTAPEPAEGPVDDVIPVKAGDMETADNHSKLRRNGDVFMFANSTLTTNVDLPAASESLSIFAHGDKADGEWPILVVTVNGEPVAQVIVNSVVEKKFWVPVHVDPGSAVIGVSYVNDLYDPTNLQDRNAYVNKIKVHVGH